MNRLVGFFFAIVFFLQGVFVQQSFAQTPTPEYKIVNVSNTPTVISAYPAMAKDSVGTVYVSWLEYDASGDGSSLYMSTLTAGQAGKPVKIYDKAGKNGGPILAMGITGGIFHFLFTDVNKRMLALDVSINTSGVKIINKTFLSPEKVTEVITDDTGQSQPVQLEVRGFGPQVVIDNQGTLHAIWIDDREGVTQAKFRTFHRRFMSGKWEPSDREIATRGILQRNLSLAVTSDNAVHMAMQLDGRMYAAKFVGSTWTSETPSTKGKFNGVALGANGNTLYAVWSSTDHNIFYAKNAGGSWTTPVQLDSSGVFDDFPGILVTGQGVYALWSSGQDVYTSNPVIRLIANNDKLSDVQIIATDARSRMIIGQQSLGSSYLVWQANGTGNWEIFSTNLFFLPSPPPPPCDKRENGKCLEVGTAFGLLCTEGECTIGRTTAIMLSLLVGPGVLIIIYAGYIIMTSRGDPEKVKRGREIIISFILGTIFIIFSFVIFEFLTVNLLGLPGFRYFTP